MVIIYILEGEAHQAPDHIGRRHKGAPFRSRFETLNVNFIYKVD